MKLPAFFCIFFFTTVTATFPYDTWQERSAESNPIIDLGKNGKYMGVVQNNGTVNSWKGIPYATPPLRELRFKAPRPLELSQEEQDQVVDVTDDALRCVQFTNISIRGVKAGPGQEDCLKIWIWAPANAKKGDSLPVHAYIHGGALQYSTAPNNDFSDWVSHDQNFIAVNLAYRLGGFGFMASQELLDEGETANAGLLDMRLALEWIQENIEEFGGDPNKVTLSGQSGGGLATVSQLVLYDGEKPAPFAQANPRSIQRSPTYKVDQLNKRNDKVAELLQCNSDMKQIDCFRNASPEKFAEAVLAATEVLDEFEFAGFIPTIDGVTITDTITNLLQAGKFVKVPLIVGYATHEARAYITGQEKMGRSMIQYKFLSEENLSHAVSMYPINETFGDPSGTGAFFHNITLAAIQAMSIFGEPAIIGSERLLASAFTKYSSPEATWSFRFDAPTVGTEYEDENEPLAFVPHSADNSYLQNATSVMRPFEEAVAKEFRAYIGSFVRTGNPNTEKLETSPEWKPYSSLGDFEKSPVRLVPAFDFRANTKKDSDSTGTGMEVMAEAQRSRIDWWLSKEILDEIKL